jgi:hypothetical protein
MGMPQSWHRRQAMVIAGQLPENTEDALLVLAAVHELVATYLAKSEHDRPCLKVAGNILPFSVS